MSQAFAPALTMSSTDTPRTGGWNTAGSVGTLGRAIAEIRLGDRGNDLGGSRFSLRGQRPGQLGTDVSRRRAPLRPGGRARSRARDDLRVSGRSRWPPGLARGRERVATVLSAHAHGRGGRDDRV